MLPRKFDYPALATLAPQIAGDEAYRRFCRPELSHHASPDQAVLQDRARVHLRKARWFAVPSVVGDIQAYEWDAAGEPNGRSVLLVHGWTSEAAFMAAFVEPLRQKGFRVISFDMPAHGHSHQSCANMIDCVQAMRAVVLDAGPVDDVVAHSLGGLVALMAAEGAAPLAGPVDLGRYVLIATPNELTEFTRVFGRHEGLTAAGQRAFERHLVRVGHRALETVSAARLLAQAGKPALVIHARDDVDVPFSNAEEIAAACPHAVRPVLQR
jgi:pimeloyl-ACP methyl ester carboxylesterase